MTPAINLFFVSYSFSGVTTYCQALTDYFSECGQVKIHIVHASTDKSEFAVEDQNNITEIFIPKPSSEINNVSKYIDRCVLLLYAEFHHLSNVVFHFNMKECIDMAKSVAHRFRCKVVYTLHFLECHYSAIKYLDIPIDQIDNTIDDKHQQMLDLADRIICVTRFSADNIEARFGVNPAKIEVIYNGQKDSPDMRILSQERKAALKNNLGFRDQERIILFAGRLERRKGIDCLIQAFRGVLLQYPESRLIIAGGGMYNDYLRLCKGIYGKVTFAGSLDKETLHSFYKIADVGVVPSRFEQCSYVAIEMMQYGLPMVVSDVPGMNELFEHRHDSLLCPCVKSADGLLSLDPDSTGLTNHISELLVHPKFASGLGRHAKKKAKDRFSMEKMGASTLEVYRSILFNQKEDREEGHTCKDQISLTPSQCT